MIDKAIHALILFMVMMGLPQADLLGAEPLPPRALARIGDHRFYHGPGINCAVLSPDGRRIASAASDPDDASAPDKKQDAYDSLIVLWDAATGERLREMHTPRGGIRLLAFSLNGKRLAAGYAMSAKKSGVTLFDAETGKPLVRLGDFSRQIGYLRFSADGKQLRVSEWGGSVSAWDVATGKQLRLWKPPSSLPLRKDTVGIDTVQGGLSPDGRVVVWEIHAPRTVDSLCVHDADTDKLLYRKNFTFYHYRGSFAFSLDSKWFAAKAEQPESGKFIVWETATGKELTTLSLPARMQCTLAPDGQQLVVFDRSASRQRLWSLETGRPLRDLHSDFMALNDDLFVTPQIFSANGKTLLLATSSTLRLFDTATGKERSVAGHRAPVAPRFSADGRTLFTFCGERRCSWDVSVASKPALLTDERRKAWEVGCLARSADDRLFLDFSEDLTRVRVREVATGRVLRELENGERNVLRGQFSLDATRVLLSGDSKRGSGRSFSLYDVKTGKRSGEIELTDPIGDPAFSPNGRLIAWADLANVIHLYDAVSGKLVRTLRSSETDLANFLCLFSPNSEYLIEGRATRTMLPTRVFQVSSGREIIRFDTKPEAAGKANLLACMSCMAWSPDSQLVAVAQEYSGTIRLLEISSGKVRAKFTGHRHGVHGLAFAPDGKTLASGGEDNVAFLWDVTGASTPTLVKKTSAAWWNDLASEDGKRAGDAIAGLLRTPEASVAFLQQRLHPAAALDEKHLTRLLADLDSDAFKQREAASRELARLGERAEAALRRALKDHPSLEMRRRLDDLLNKFERAAPQPETLRTLRAIEILEHVGTAEARRCLHALEKGAPQTRQTREAKRALERLAKHGSGRKSDRQRETP